MVGGWISRVSSTTKAEETVLVPPLEMVRFLYIEGLEGKAKLFPLLYSTVLPLVVMWLFVVMVGKTRVPEVADSRRVPAPFKVDRFVQPVAPKSRVPPALIVTVFAVNEFVAETV